VQLGSRAYVQGEGHSRAEGTSRWAVVRHSTRDQRAGGDAGYRRCVDFRPVLLQVRASRWRGLGGVFTGVSEWIFLESLAGCRRAAFCGVRPGFRPAFFNRNIVPG
jgi:hypothetical protein